MGALDITVIVAYLLGMAGMGFCFMRRNRDFVANYIVCFGLDAAPIPGKPHLLLYGFLGMVACLIVSPIASRRPAADTTASAERRRQDETGS